MSGKVLEERIEELLKLGKVVKIFVLMNPHNPLGCVYSEEVVMDVLRVCEK